MAARFMELWYKTYGTGEPLLILHGLLGSLDNWHTFASRCADRYRVIVPDARNHGRSPHSGEFSYEAMTADCVELLDRERVDAVHCIGHSMGGKTAMMLALRHPDRVRTLTVVDIAPRAYPPHHGEIFKALYAVDPALFGSRGDVEEQLAGRIPNEAVRRFLMKNLTRTQEGTLGWKMNLDAITANYDRINEAITSPAPFRAPVLFIRGANSSYIQPADTESIAALFPNAAVAVIEGAGHWVHADNPEAFERSVRAFLVQYRGTPGVG